ncbi:polysaccharide pyruvyl transferase family protein [Salinibacterium sp. G-O1]|uniref:polysaccharide pyruvyl transferase family protein n=1 Tax=Salinibacterium sp. G-O1 TaxID=3046208 RepID=UPI0024BB5239|nr:polysaccharide pyruvyl transferase family protein [Salinibacterium sp. G-O1]MDJ0335876.1 polysaccharide pyruvyl transferase family protein [Salinibacterium sp. G-O1]
MPQRIVVIGDIGVVDSMIHIGDEAMFEAAVDAMRQRGITDITGISSAPSESSARYGISAVMTIGWPASRLDREARLAAVIAAVRNPETLDAGDPAHEVISAIRNSNGMLIAGGGNMSTLWPHHIFERSALGAIAVALGKPLVVSGQTIGPELDDADSALVRELLGSADLVGVREPSSFALCDRLGVADVTQTIDDASFLVADDVPTSSDYCLVSVASHVGDATRADVVRALATMLDEIASHTGLDIVFFAHFGPLDGPSRGDAVMHDAAIEAMTSPARVVAPVDSVSGARLARGASMVVSSRYHPVVFAVPAGVPTIGIPVDDYTGVKLRGALGNFGQDGVLSVEELLAGNGSALVARLWADRDVIRSNASTLEPRASVASSSWWDRIATIFGASL